MSDLIHTLREDWNKEAPELDTSAMDVVGRVIHLASHWHELANEALKPLGLSYTDFDIIASLRRSGPPYELTPTQLCDAILLTSGAMTSALSRVEKAGLITRRSGPEDRRVKTAQLTTKGIALAYEASKIRFKLAENSLDGLSSNERKTMSDLLLKLL